MKMYAQLEKPYYNFFRNLHPDTLEEVRWAKEEGIWRVDEEEGFEILKELGERLSNIYDIPAPTLEKGPREVYYPYREHIEVPKVSLVSYLHEFRHHMQHHGMQHYDDKEVDARGWSMSAFRYALPENFDSAWRRGLIWFLPEYDPGEVEV